MELTEKGGDTTVEAAPGHVASVRRHFVDLLSHDQLRALGDLAAVVGQHLESERPLSP